MLPAIVLLRSDVNSDPIKAPNPAEAPAGIVNDGVAPLDMLASIE